MKKISLLLLSVSAFTLLGITNIKPNVTKIVKAVDDPVEVYIADGIWWAPANGNTFPTFKRMDNHTIVDFTENFDIQVVVDDLVVNTKYHIDYDYIDTDVTYTHGELLPYAVRGATLSIPKEQHFVSSGTEYVLTNGLSVKWECTYDGSYDFSKTNSNYVLFDSINYIDLDFSDCSIHENNANLFVGFMNSEGKHLTISKGMRLPISFGGIKREIDFLPNGEGYPYLNTDIHNKELYENKDVGGVYIVKNNPILKVYAGTLISNFDAPYLNYRIVQTKSIAFSGKYDGDSWSGYLFSSTKPINDIEQDTDVFMQGSTVYDEANKGVVRFIGVIRGELENPVCGFSITYNSKTVERTVTGSYEYILARLNKDAESVMLCAEDEPFYGNRLFGFEMYNLDVGNYTFVVKSFCGELEGVKGYSSAKTFNVLVTLNGVEVSRV